MSTSIDDNCLHTYPGHNCCLSRGIEIVEYRYHSALIYESLICARISQVSYIYASNKTGSGLVTVIVIDEAVGSYQVKATSSGLVICLQCEVVAL